MIYDFDTPINRYNTNSIKFDHKKQFGQPEDVIPMWVADMDYPVLPDVTEAIIRRANHPVYGYTEGGNEYYQSVMEWMQKRHGYGTKKDWYIITPGVIFALSVAIRAYTEPEDSIMINTPVYRPFFRSIEQNGRKAIKVPLQYDRQDVDRYVMNFTEIEEKILENNVKMFVLCNPHNPVGRVWTKEELMTLGDILKKHGVLLVSDEIHMDFIYSGHKHHVFAGLREDYQEFTITCTSPSKTFNLSGLQIANTIIVNPKLRMKFIREMRKTGYDHPNIFGLEACQAAYEHGADYLDQMVRYLESNKEYAEDYIRSNLPKIKFSPMEGTYLMWLDFQDYGLSKEEISKILMHKAKIWLNQGEIFGEEGSGFQRINIAVPRQQLIHCLEQIKKAFS